MEETIEELRSEKGVTVLRYGDTFIKVKPVKVESLVDSDKVTKIDVSNLVAEIITIPVLLNRWGNILASCEAELKREKLDFEIFCAKTKDLIRKDFAADPEKKKFTVSEVDDALTLKKEFAERKRALIDVERDRDVASSIYWAVKEKADKLDKMSLTLTKDDIDNMEATIMHGITISTRKFKQ